MKDTVCISPAAWGVVLALCPRTQVRMVQRPAQISLPQASASPGTVLVDDAAAKSGSSDDEDELQPLRQRQRQKQAKPPGGLREESYAPAPPFGKSVRGRSVHIVWPPPSARGQPPTEDDYYNGTIKDVNALGEHLVTFEDNDQAWYRLEQLEQKGWLRWLGPGGETLPPPPPRSTKANSSRAKGSSRSAASSSGSKLPRGEVVWAKWVGLGVWWPALMVDKDKAAVKFLDSRKDYDLMQVPDISTHILPFAEGAHYVTSWGGKGRAYHTTQAKRAGFINAVIDAMQLAPASKDSYLTALSALEKPSSKGGKKPVQANAESDLSDYELERLW